MKRIDFTTEFSVEVDEKDVLETNANPSFSEFRKGLEDDQYFIWVIPPIMSEFVAPKEETKWNPYDKVENLKESVKNASQEKISKIMLERYHGDDNSRICNVSDFSFEGMVLDMYSRATLDKNLNPVLRTKKTL